MLFRQYKQLLSDTRFQTGFLLVVLVGLLVAYFYLLSSSVLHVVLSREYSRSYAEIGSAITELEAEYIQMQHSVRSNIAYQSGFVPVAKKTFVTPFDTTLVAGRDDR